MIKLPYWAIAYLPKEWQDKCVQNIWDKKSDESILHAYKDAQDWIELSNAPYYADGIVHKIADDCFQRLDKYIKPQMSKRGLF